MSDVFTDQQLRKVLEGISKTQPRSLWLPADGIAFYLALTGSFEDALSIWHFLWSEVPPDQTRRHENQCAAPEMVCYLTQTPDFIDPQTSLEDRVRQNEAFARMDLTADVWNLAPGTEPPPVFNLRRARDLAHCPLQDEFSPTELEALTYLVDFFADPGIAISLIDDAHLLFADIAERHNRREEAVAHLKSWGEILQKRPYSVSAWQVLALPPLVQLVANRNLEFLTRLSRSERSEIAQQTIAETRKRLNQGTPRTFTQTSILCDIFHSFFAMQGAVSDLENEPATYFEGLQPPPSDYPTEVHVAAPGETGSARFHLRFEASMPDLQRGVFAITFPFRAEENPQRGELTSRIGNVFLSSIDEGGDVGFEVPAGDYDVAAIWTRGKGNKCNEEVGLRHFEVDLCFLPRSTCSGFGPQLDRSWDDQSMMPNQTT